MTRAQKDSGRGVLRGMVALAKTCRLQKRPYGEFPIRPVGKHLTISEAEVNYSFRIFKIRMNIGFLQAAILVPSPEIDNSKSSKLYNDARGNPALLVLGLVAELGQQPICLHQT